MVSLAYGFDNAKDKEAVYTQAETATAMHSIFDPMIAAKQDQHLTRTATLLSSGWSSNAQIINVAGVTATNTVIVSAAAESLGLYSSHGVVCIGQGAGTLTFSCDYEPDSNISINVVILGLGA